MDSPGEGSTRTSSCAEDSVAIPLPSPSETAIAIAPSEPKCQGSLLDDCQASISNEFVPIIGTQIASTDILSDFQRIYEKFQKVKRDSELALLSEKDKQVDLKLQLTEKEELLKKASAKNNSLREALSEKEEEVKNLKRQLDEDNGKFQELGNIVGSFQCIKVGEAIVKKEIPSETSTYDDDPKLNERNYNPSVSPSSSYRVEDIIPLPVPLQTAQITDDASTSTQTNSESRIKVKTGGDCNKSETINHGIDRKESKSKNGFYCLCGTELKTKYDLRDHVRGKDPTSYVFRCHRCKKKLQNMMKQHQLCYSFYGCRTCGAQLSSFVELLNHYRLVHNFKTKNANTKRSDPFSINIRHTKVTSKDPAKFLCSCGIEYKIRKSLTNHIYRSRILKKKKSVVSAEKDKVQSEPRHGLAKPTNP